MRPTREPRRRARVGAVVQARMSSTRLPGKALVDIEGKPALVMLLDRLQDAAELCEIVVATSVDPADDVIASTAEKGGFRIVRGPRDDVLERYRQAVEQLGWTAIVRITGDCPFVDPGIVNRAVHHWRTRDTDYVANCMPPRTYPNGLDVEVVSAEAIRSAARDARTSAEREHVTPFIAGQPERFRLARLDLAEDRGRVRVTLDTSADLRLLRAIVRDIGHRAPADAILRWLDEHPERMLLDDAN